MRYSPLVAADRPNGVWLEVAGSAHLFGGEEALLQDLTRRLRRAGVNARAAIADTPGAAWAVARHASERIIVPGGMAAAIAELPVAALRLPTETVDALRRLGVERIGQLAAMPNAPLTRRFGPDVRRRLDQALGHAAEPFDELMPPEIIRRRLAFAEPIGSREALSSVVTRLCGDLCSDLAAKSLGVRRLDLVFGRRLCGGACVAGSCEQTGLSACPESGGAPTMSARRCATTTASKPPTAPRYWVFRDGPAVEGVQWFLHGLFA